MSRDRFARWTTFLVGVGLSVALIARSQVGGDQWNLLARGWLVVAQGAWIPYGNPTSAGGDEIGSFTTLVVALPLWIWKNYRAPALFVLLSHIVAFALVDDVVRRTTGPRERRLVAVLYWLNPWRLYFSGHLWNPNFLFLAGAVHLWTADRQRLRGRWLSSFVHVAAIGFACQLHPSAIALAIASGWLVWTRRCRVHAPGALLAAAVVLASLVPWMREVARVPGILPIGHGFIGRGLILVFPLARGLLYWIRYSSLSIGGRMVPFDFTAIAGGPIDRWLSPSVSLVVTIVGAASTVPAAMATLWLLQRAWRRRRTAFHAEGASGRLWLEGYVVGVLGAAAIAFSLAPTTVMFWQGFVIFHAAVLPLVLWLGVLLRTRRAASVWLGVRLAGAASVVLVALMAAGSPLYRCGGRDGLVTALKEDYPMIHDLHVGDACAVPIDADHGWVPDVFRPSSVGTGATQAPR